ncbi:MAG TPA: hypothetical protein VGT79_09730 [Xanthomonadaceae bacterium]|nr:hypothetical protein [Xanthomonadaceae bacterium]
MNATPFFHIDLATILNLVSTIAIVGALIFTALQVRQANRWQRDQAALAMIKTVMRDTLTRSMELLAELPAGAQRVDIERSGPETGRALLEFGVGLESIGYMAFRRMVSLKTVDELMGGMTLMYWSRAKSWAEQERTRTGNPRFFEWCEWLADRIGERRAQRRHVPAQLQHALWRE